MGIQLRRMPLDFNWPINKTWTGFLNPHLEHCHDCQACNGSGYSPEAKRVYDQWYGNAPFDPVAYGSRLFSPDHPLIVEGVKRKFVNEAAFYMSHPMMGPPLARQAAFDRECRRMAALFNAGWMHHLNVADVQALWDKERLFDFRNLGRIPTPIEVNEWSLVGFGHDSINNMYCVSARCEREGIAQDCASCDGNGHTWDSPEAEAAADAWEETEPPTGEGYQMWQTVSEGSPISPVFKTPRELAVYLADNPWGATEDMDADDWEKFIVGPGCSASMVSGPDGIQSGPKAAIEGR